MLVHIENEIVCGITESEQLYMRLQREARVSADRCGFGYRQGRELRVVEGLNAGPFDASYIERKSRARPCKLRILREPVEKPGAEIAKRKGAAGMSGKIRIHQCFESLCADHGAQCGEIFMKGSLQTEPVLAVVDFEPLKGCETAVGGDEVAGDFGHVAAIPTASNILRLHLFVRGERLHHGGAHGSLQVF